MSSYVKCPYCAEKTPTKQRKLGPPKLTYCKHCKGAFHPLMMGTPSPGKRKNE